MQWNYDYLGEILVHAGNTCAIIWGLSCGFQNALLAFCNKNNNKKAYFSVNNANQNVVLTTFNE